jgi:hypothetical protein
MASLLLETLMGYLNRLNSLRSSWLDLGRPGCVTELRGSDGKWFLNCLSGPDQIEP